MPGHSARRLRRRGFQLHLRHQPGARPERAAPQPSREHGPTASESVAARPSLQPVTLHVSR
jgi:hypothetical protein